LIENYDPAGFELFDLAEDIGEQEDLSKTMPEKVEQLGNQLNEWLRSVNTRMHTPNPDYRGN